MEFVVGCIISIELEIKAPVNVLGGICCVMTAGQ